MLFHLMQMLLYILYLSVHGRTNGENKSTILGVIRKLIGEKVIPSGDVVDVDVERVIEDLREFII